MRYSIKGHNIYNNEVELATTDTLEIAKYTVKTLYDQKYGMDENILSFIIYDNIDKERVYCFLW